MMAHALFRQIHVPVRNGLENGVVLAEAIVAEIRGQPVDPEAPPPACPAKMLAVQGPRYTSFEALKAATKLADLLN